MDKLIVIQLVYAACCITLAWLNYRIIQKEIRPNHSYNGVIHLILWCFATLFYRSFWMFILLPLIGRVVFDVSLNLMRKKDWDYVSPEVKAGDRRSSVIDLIEWRFFRSGSWPKVIYLVIVVALNIYLLL